VSDASSDGRLVERRIARLIAESAVTSSSATLRSVAVVLIVGMVLAY